MNQESLADLRIRDNLELDERAEDMNVGFALQILKNGIYGIVSIAFVQIVVNNY
jgi:hypothetical protein